MNVLKPRFEIDIRRAIQIIERNHPALAVSTKLETLQKELLEYKKCQKMLKNKTLTPLHKQAQRRLEIIEGYITYSLTRWYLEGMQPAYVESILRVMKK